MWIPTGFGAFLVYVLMTAFTVEVRLWPREREETGRVIGRPFHEWEGLIWPLTWTAACGVLALRLVWTFCKLFICFILWLLQSLIEGAYRLGEDLGRKVGRTEPTESSPMEQRLDRVRHQVRGDAER
jgi:hypothetical protein